MWAFLYRLAWGAAKVAAPLLATGDGKFARSLRGRIGGAAALLRWASLSRDTKRPLAWFHAASVGEGRQAEAVLRRLRAAHPGWQIVYTHASASAERLAASLPADFAGYLPADTPADVAGALDAVRPTTLVFSATDLWPELVAAAARRGVRLALISATMAPGSSRGGAPARSLLGTAYAALDAVGAIDPGDAERLVALGARRDRVSVTGDTRHDSAAARIAAVDRNAAHVAVLLRSGEPVLAAGSTWAADERVLLPALGQARRQVGRLPLVIAPHEPGPAHLGELRGRILRQLPGSRVVPLSELETLFARNPSQVLPAWDVCLVDRVGILAELYVAATMAYVGGGFHSAGLHSVIEPAAAGIPVVFGPRWRNSRDAALLLEHHGGVSVETERALARVLNEWIRDPAARQNAGAAARGVVDRGLGAAERSLRLIADGL